MKTKISLSILALGVFLSALGQNTLELTFTAENNGHSIPLDSILVENITQPGDTTLYTPDTVLVLEYVSGIGDNEATEKNTFSISQNYPNPFNEKTEVHLYLPKEELIKIVVTDILGSKQAHIEIPLRPGNHTFVYYPGNEKTYFLTVTGNKKSRTIKMLNLNNSTITGRQCKITYNGLVDRGILKSQQAINGFGFNMGDELKYIAYSGIGEVLILDSPEGNQIYTFQFAGIPCPGTPILTDMDGNVYGTVLIGSQCWMKENLKTTSFNNGLPIPNVPDSAEWRSIWSAAYVWYDNDVALKNLYGALYNWYTVNDTNGLCPSGWHVPSNVEWTTLTNFIGGENSPQGNELKSCRQVNSPLGGDCNTMEHPRWNNDTINGNYGTDDYGFSGLPGGFRSNNGGFTNLGIGGLWWTSTTYSGLSAWHRGLYFSGGEVYPSTWGNQNGFSVRCIRD